MNQDNMPLVTAVIPVYNHEKYVAESIRSIVNQTYQNIELIVINDGSKDRSHQMILPLVEECRQRFVRFEYINRENIGLCATLNQALAWARGDYLSALASDDVALPEKIEVLVEALEAKDPTYAAAFGNAWFIDDDGQRMALDESERVCPVATAGTFHDYLEHRSFRGTVVEYRTDKFGAYETLLAHNYLPAMSNIVRAELIRKVNGRTDGNVSEDWEMWRKLSRKHKFIYVDKIVALYRWHDSNSWKVMGDKLKLGSLLLLLREKQFCSRHNLMKAWRRAYISLLEPVFRDNRIALRQKLSMLDAWEVPYVVFNVSHRLARETPIRNKRKS